MAITAETREEFMKECMAEGGLRQECEQEWEQMNQAEAVAPATRAELLIYEAIGGDWFGEGLTAKSLAEQLSAIPPDVAEINVRINSPGGVVWDGIAIYNSLVNHPARIIVDIEGLAASAASFVAMAGDEIRMAENALMMIHLAQGMAIGDKREMLKLAEILDKHDQTIALTYAKRTGRKPREFLALMAAETWLSAAEAKREKLVDSITPALTVTACVGPECAGKWRHAPEAVKQFVRLPVHAVRAAAVRACAAGRGADGRECHAASDLALQLRLRLLDLA